jgi:hypothetical protein
MLREAMIAPICQQDDLGETAATAVRVSAFYRRTNDDEDGQRLYAAQNMPFEVEDRQMPITRDQATELVGEGVVTYAQLLNDLEIAKFAALVLRKVLPAFEQEIHAGDTCKIAFPSVIVRPEIRMECLCAVLNDRLVIAWKPPLRKVKSLVIPTSTISDIHREAGTGALRGAQLLVVSGTPSAKLGLTKTNANMETSIIRNAVGIGD